VKSSEILIVKMADLFLIRHPTGRFLTRSNPQDVDLIRWSTKLLQAVSSCFTRVVIFYDIVKEKGGTWPDTSIRNVIESLGLQNVELVKFSSLIPDQAMEVWKKRIMGLGGKWDRPANHLNSNYMNIDTMVTDSRFLWANADGVSDTTFIPEKVTSFMDLAKDRESKAIW